MGNLWPASCGCGGPLRFLYIMDGRCSSLHGSVIFCFPNETNSVSEELLLVAVEAEYPEVLVLSLSVQKTPWALADKNHPLQE